MPVSQINVAPSANLHQMAGSIAGLMNVTSSGGNTKFRQRRFVINIAINTPPLLKVSVRSLPRHVPAVPGAMKT
ncbi:hypothetical protein KCP69_09115 [Salmonella enterica subsp. enterica]|nr:hypothetical protein KCP69_09115 [Salmonella enterica subsp. enterica]